MCALPCDGALTYVRVQVCKRGEHHFGVQVNALHPAQPRCPSPLQALARRQDVESILSSTISRSTLASLSMHTSKSPSATPSRQPRGTLALVRT